MLKHLIRPMQTTLMALGAALLVVSLGAAPASAAKKAKSIQTEAKFVSYDAAAKTITVVVKKTGSKPDNAKLKLVPNKNASFKVRPEGSVLTRTSVTLNGQRAQITDIPEDKTINIYWVPDETDAKARFARKIDMILSDEELEARDLERTKAAKEAGQVADE